MAVVTPVSQVNGREAAKPFMGLRHEVYTFGALGNGDVWTYPGVGPRIVNFAWRPANAINSRWTLTTNNNAFICVTGVGLTGGTLHVWCKGG